MSDIATVFKGEISRLARKELRLQLEPFKKTTALLKEQIGILRTEVTALKKQLKQPSKAPIEKKIADPEIENEVTRQRFTAKGLQTLRSRLGLSFEEMGTLLGASDQSVRKWESGGAIPRQKYQEKIFALRGVGKRELANRLNKTVD